MRALFLLLLPAVAFAALPEGAGLAAKYPRGGDLARDAAVVLAEDFESGGIADLEKRWTEVSNKDGKVLALDTDQPAASGGKRALRITSTLGENTGGHLYTPLARGLETAFARFYVKFAADAQPVHHFVHFGGYRPVTRWPQGGAGDRPRGDDRFTVGIEPHVYGGRFSTPGAWSFYAYWSEMKVSADGRYWGNGIPPVSPAPVPQERWQCVEVMLKCNSTPEKADGELALWLDGKLTNHLAPGTRRGPWTGMGFQPLAGGGEPFEGFRWRSHPELKVNFFWLLFYVTDYGAQQAGTTPNPVNRVWFDDIVVASEYIGPTQP